MKTTLLHTVRFHDFARGQAPVEVPVGYPTTDVVAKLAKKHCGLLSRGIDAEYDEPGEGQLYANTGVVFAGVHAVGRFTVSEIKP